MNTQRILLIFCLPIITYMICFLKLMVTRGFLNVSQFNAERRISAMPNASLSKTRVVAKKHPGNNETLSPLQYTPGLPRNNTQRYKHDSAWQRAGPNSSEHQAVSNIGPGIDINELLQPMGEPQIDCHKLFLRDKNETRKAKKLMTSNPYKHIPLSHFARATVNCTKYRLARGVVGNVSREERDFPLAFSILVHADADQFERLLRAIYRPSNYYCIHVDKKVNQEFMKAIKAIISCYPNAFIASKLEVVVYAGFTRLQADINCMEELLEKYGDWKYVINLAGSEMPLKTNLEMVQLLKLYNGTNLVGKDMQTLNFNRWQNRYETVVSGLSGYIRKVNDSYIPAPFNLTVSKSSAYVLLTRAMVKYVLEDPVPRALLEWSRHTWSPDEQFWATLNNLEHNPHLATPGGNRCAENAKKHRAVQWFWKDCQGKEIHAVCVFGVGDLWWVFTRPEFVLNKLYLDVDYVAMYCVEQLLEDRKTNTVPWDLGQHTAYLKQPCITQHQ